MRIIVQFLSEDGTIFSKYNDALDRDRLYSKVIEMDLLIGYINLPQSEEHTVQLTANQVNLFKAQLISLSSIECNRPDWLSETFIHPLGVVPRIVNDTNSLLYRHWTVLASIDKNNILHSQPYYANQIGYR